MTTIINLGFLCCQAFLLNSFCRATGIFYHDGCYTIILLSFKTLENASTWIILLPFLCLMIKSYCWSLHNYQAFFPDGKFIVHIVSRTIWSIIILKGFTFKYCLNFSMSHITAKHSCLVMGYFFSYSLKVLLAQAIIRSLSSSPFWYNTALTPLSSIIMRHS